MTMANDNELIAHAQAGDEQAYAELIQAYYPFVYGIVIRIVNNPLDAEEVVQDTFVNVYRGLPQYQEIEKFKNWLAKIARNCARNRVRKQQIDTVPIDEVNQQLSATTDLPDEQLIRNEQRELIRRAMDTLSEKDREIAQSYYLEGASYDELIQTHGLSYKAISFRLSRAKQRLTKRLSHLLATIVISPATTLKQIYSGGLTVMKIGTAPKITVGGIGLVGLLFIGIGVHHILPKSDSAKDTATSVQAEAPSEALVETDTNQEAENRENQPQISDKDMEQIKGFFAQLEAEDTQSDGGTMQSPTESKAEAATTDTDAGSENTEQSAEDVMNAYLDAYKNGDFETLLPLVTGTAKEELQGVLRLLNGGLFEDMMNNVKVDATIVNNVDKDAIPEGIAKAELIDQALQIMPEVIQEMDGLMQGMMQEMFGGAEIVNSEYVEDEFHFRMSIPAPKIGRPELPDTLKISIDIPEIEQLVKMQKVDGTWRIYDTGGK